jgi:hypothetical protein
VCVALLSSLCSSIGLTLQKRSHKIVASREAADAAAPPGSPKVKHSVLKQPLFLLGIGMMLVGAIMSFAVFALLGQGRASAMAVGGSAPQWAPTDYRSCGPLWPPTAH